MQQPATGYDAAEAFRRARAKRRASAVNPLLAALGAQSDQSDTRAPAAAAVQTSNQYTDPDLGPELEIALRDFETDTPAEPVGPVVTPAAQSMFVPRADNGVLVDPVVLFTEIWRKRWLVAGTTLAGAALGLALALTAESRYLAYAQLLLDPRDVKLLERDLAPDFLANEAALAIIDSRLSLVTSRQVLEKVIERTNLDQDAEFNGSAAGGGLISSVRSILSSDTPAESAERDTLENLREAIATDRTNRTFVVNVGVEARSPDKAALLANEVTRAFVEEQSSIKSTRAGEANEALTGRLTELKAAVEQAEKAADTFRSANGLETAQGRLLSDERLASASISLNDARSATIRARAKAEGASAADLDAVIAGALPIDLNTPALTTFRAQYASLRQQEASLEQQLGPRHPRLANAKASVEAARQDISAELRRIVQGAQSELRRAVETEQELAAQFARAKAEIANASDPLVTLRDLELEAEAARELYKSALLRARETGELEKLTTVNATILSAAEAPSDPSSTSRKVILAAWTIAGLIIGLMIAGLLGLAKALGFSGAQSPRADNAAPRTTRPAPSSPSPDGPKPGNRDRNRPPHENPTEPSAMYPGYPYPPQPFAPQAYAPQAQAPMAAQTYVQAPPMQTPMPSPPMPMMQVYPQQQPQGWMPQMQAPVAPMQQGWYPTPMMPQPAPYAPMPNGYWPQPQPVFQQPMPQPMQPAAMAQPMQPAPSADDHEISDLRQSLSDIRDVVDALLARRDTRRRFG